MRLSLKDREPEPPPPPPEPAPPPEPTREEKVDATLEAVKVLLERPVPTPEVIVKTVEDERTPKLLQNITRLVSKLTTTPSPPAPAPGVKPLPRELLLPPPGPALPPPAPLPEVAPATPCPPPSWTFEIERDAIGRMTRIHATPT